MHSLWINSDFNTSLYCELIKKTDVKWYHFSQSVHASVSKSHPVASSQQQSKAKKGVACETTKNSVNGCVCVHIVQRENVAPPYH